MKKNSSAFLFFLLVSSAYFYKSFADNLIPGYHDVFGYVYPITGLVKDHYLRGELPLWNNYMFSGFPVMGSLQPAVFYPLTVIPALLFPLYTAIQLFPVIHYTLAGFFTFLYAKRIGMNFYASLAAGGLFAFMGYLVPNLGHFATVRTAIWLPLILYFFEDIRDNPRLKSALKASLAIAIQIFAGHFQVCFYTYLIVLFFIVYSLFFLEPGRRVRFLAFAGTAFAVGIIIASPQLYATMELFSYSVREKITYEAFSGHSFSLKNMPTLLLPLLHAAKPAGYMGIMPLLLAVVACATGIKENIHIRFWAMVAVISFALALGDALGPLNKALFHVPLYNSFRAAERHIIAFSLSLSILAGFGISMILAGEKAKKSLALLLTLMIALFSLFIVLLVQSGPQLLTDIRVQLALVFAFVSALMVGGVLKTERYGYFKYILLFVLVIEILSFRSAKWVKTSEVDHHYSDLFSRFEEGTYRVAFFHKKIVFMLGLRHGIHLTEGYDPLIWREYNALLQLLGIGSWSNAWPQLVENNMILSMLNTKYIVLPPGWEIKAADSRYGLVEKNKDYLLYENKNCLPRAFSVLELVGIDKFGDIHAALYSFQVNPLKQAIVSVSDLKEIAVRKFSQGTVALDNYSSKRVVLKTDFTDNGFVVLSDHYYQGWKAFIDGKPTTIYKTNAVMRGVVVPPGVHELIFIYQPLPIYGLIALSLLTLIGSLAVLIRKK